MTVYCLIVDRPLTQATDMRTFELHARLERDGDGYQFMWFRWTPADAETNELDVGTQMKLASMALHAARIWQRGDQADGTSNPSIAVELRPGIEGSVALVDRFTNEPGHVIGEWSDWRASDLRRHVMRELIEADERGDDLAHAFRASIHGAGVTERDNQNMMRWLLRQGFVDAIESQAADRDFYVFEVQELTPAAFDWAKEQVVQAANTPATTSGVPYALGAEQFSDVLESIGKHQDSIERYPGAGPAIDAGEDDHRDDLLKTLRVKYIDGTGESYSLQGKTDIRILVDNNAFFYAECKIWDGPSTVDEAVEQLVGRYLTYRDKYGALIFFVRDRVKPAELPPKAIDRLVTQHAGIRRADVANFPVVAVPANGGAMVELALIFIVVDQAPPR